MITEIKHSLLQDKKNTWKLYGWFRSHFFPLSSVMKFMKLKYATETTKWINASVVNYYIKKKTTATKTSTLNFSPCAEEAEASSDSLILSNICKVKNKIPENKKIIKKTPPFILQSKLFRSTVLFLLHTKTWLKWGYTIKINFCFTRLP